MSKQIIQLPVQELAVGAYVSRLDRPWEGTPFLFQGFTIESEDEIKELQRHCQHVFVQVTVEEAAERRAELAKRKPVDEPVLPPEHIEEVSLAIRASNPPEHFVDTVSLQVELADIKDSYVDAKRTVANVFENMQLGRNLEVAQLEPVVEWMVDSVFRNRDAMGWLSRMKSMDDYLYSHSIAASVWALALGRHLGLDKETLSSIGMGAMLLDIGKTKLPPELVNSPNAPNDKEWALLRTHVGEGVKLARETKGVNADVLSMIATHHERFDGTGYPRKLVGADIPLVGQIGGIVDCYDAMISKRRYAQARSTFDAMRELTRLAGSWFQPELIESFVQAVGVFPTGTLVELNTGEVGVVIAQNRFRRLRPEVMLLLDASKHLLKDFTIVDLNTCEENNTPGKAGLWIARGHEAHAFGIDPTEYFL